MKVLVTGATGFVGNHVIHELLNTEHTIIATSTNEGSAHHFDWFDYIEYVPWTIGNEINTNLFNYFHQPDLCIHLAWDRLTNFRDPSHEVEVFESHLNFTKTLITQGLSKLTVTGTCLEYGLTEGELNEGLAPNPTIPYPIGKNKLRIELENLQNTNSFELDWVRLFYMFGKGQNPKSILALLETHIQENEMIFNMSGGEQIRDYLPVEKIAEIIITLALLTKGSGTINCCSGSPIKIVDLVKNYIDNRNASIALNLGHYPYLDYEPFEFWGSTKKLNKVLDAAK